MYNTSELLTNPGSTVRASARRLFDCLWRRWRNDAIQLLTHQHASIVVLMIIYIYSFIHLIAH
jgi:hypothetical protein